MNDQKSSGGEPANGSKTNETSPNETVLVDTRLGRVKGLVEGLTGRLSADSSGPVMSFLGLRYGQPPTGSLRFMPPVAATAWEGVFDATQWPNRPMQGRPEGTLGQEIGGEESEDCLFLNLVTPGAADARRPVLVWVHGGGLNAGSANEYDGRVLSRQGDVVVVTINYRLGAFGFLDLSQLGPEFDGSAGTGFRDMILALEWVQKNVEDFGGDPGNVTLFGESAGALSILRLLAAPKAEGLFHKAIASSPGAPAAPQGNKLEAIAEKLAVDDGSVLETLQQMSATELLRAGLPAGDSIDGTVITSSTKDAIIRRGASGVPLIVGTNRNEGTLFTPPDSEDEDLSRYQRWHAPVAKGVIGDRDPEAYLVWLKETYGNSKRVSEELTAAHFRSASVEAAQASTAAGPGGWLYRFDLQTTREHKGKLTGATHACEMAFTFNAFADPDCRVFAFHDRENPVVQELAAHWSETLLAFAAGGDPNGGGLPEWPLYDATARSCMMLDAECRVEMDPDEAQRSFWNGGD